MQCRRAPTLVLCKTGLHRADEGKFKSGTFGGLFGLVELLLRPCGKTNLKAPNRVRRESGVEVIGLGLSWCREYMRGWAS